MACFPLPRLALQIWTAQLPQIVRRPALHIWCDQRWPCPCPPGMKYRQQSAGLNRSVSEFQPGCFTVFSCKGMPNYGWSLVTWHCFYFFCWTQGSWTKGAIIFLSASETLGPDFLVFQYRAMQIVKSSPTVWVHLPAPEKLLGWGSHYTGWICLQSLNLTLFPWEVQGLQCQMSLLLWWTPREPLWSPLMLTNPLCLYFPLLLLETSSQIKIKGGLTLCMSITRAMPVSRYQNVLTCTRPSSPPGLCWSLCPWGLSAPLGT